MIHWRHEEDKKKKKDSVKDDLELGPEHASIVPTHACQSPATRSASRSPETSHGRLQHASGHMEPHSFALSSGPGSSRWQLTATETAKYFPHFHETTQSTKERVLTDYEESEKHEERQIRALVTGLATFYGSLHDPFKVLPQFEDSHLNALYLARSCESGPGCENDEHGC